MSDLGLTPSQTVGPYLSIGLIGGPITPHVVPPDDPAAIPLRGLLLDGAGEPVLDGMVEVWQASPSGRYAHHADPRLDLYFEPGFVGFARSGTAPAGRYELTVTRPGRVPWPGGGFQAPHLLLSIFARGLLKRVATRVYFPDEIDANAEDPVLSRLPAKTAATLFASHEDGGLRFDVRLQGPDATTFFAV
jgi:protocatechuate 3,4-dioxygenase alpha subunit